MAQPPQIVLGVMGVRRKLDRKPMQSIFTSLTASEPRLQLIILDEHDMKHPVSKWPPVNVLLTVHSSDFPHETVLKYVALHSPLLINNIHTQSFMMDRRVVRHILKRAGVPIAPAVNVDRSAGDHVDQPDSTRDTLVVHRPEPAALQTIHKPFVEKPVSANDHNVYIYYKGGGVRKLFRKVKNLSSTFHPELRLVRSSGDFIYEQFYEPEHRADVKVYAVGDYFHAESRKAPHIDGIVDRDHLGCEKRTRVLLSEEERQICQRVKSTFGQFVIGFDLLRGSESQRFVIDVNGWSVVKNSDEYTARAGKLLAKHILEKSEQLDQDDSSDSSSTMEGNTPRHPELFDSSQNHSSACPV